jgi:hypothetical protein
MGRPPSGGQRPIVSSDSDSDSDLARLLLSFALCFAHRLASAGHSIEAALGIVPPCLRWFSPPELVTLRVCEAGLLLLLLISVPLVAVDGIIAGLRRRDPDWRGGLCLLRGLWLLGWVEIVLVSFNFGSRVRL